MSTRAVCFWLQYKYFVNLHLEKMFKMFSDIAGRNLGA